ncbi:ribose 5-phosphate isomerase B [Pseudodesulfovibrio senegalensis]|jgi:ribose 5-phosphate isomerase B|uniref:Ribose 5-phosphate isomerase B n=1 Tax=Pseudodesulfovibrio senegalensis TaxID=1721087 RepID=A0A6N6MY09_9BACT|nr:ribose 5-phosphate isomerase B [Pseudodesulfovibrio senegalensis]KAB1439104.1 ribose 5-phosphate isomerase B [Pseudodesulfovibrio senegalensis]
MAKTIIIGSDHGGFNLKKHLVALLESWGYTVLDQGPDRAESCDYPEFAAKVAKRVLDGEGQGILICGTGLGMSMAANRFSGVRAAVCTNEFMARMCRAHNDANVLCLGERVIGIGTAEGIVKAYLETEFEGDRHKRRIDLIETVSK